LSGKFIPILKENWNAEDLNFSIHLLNLNLLRHELWTIQYIMSPEIKIFVFAHILITTKNITKASKNITKMVYKSLERSYRMQEIRVRSPTETIFSTLNLFTDFQHINISLMGCLRMIEHQIIKLFINIICDIIPL